MAKTTRQITEYNDYRKLLTDWIESLPNRGRGVRSQLAQAMGCRIAFVTHVLSGRADLSAEQSEAATRFFGWTGAEQEFFLLLVQYNRAGTPTLREFYLAQIQKLRARLARQSSKLGIRGALGKEAQAIYYSHAHYTAIHLLTLIPEMQTPPAIAKRLGIAERSVHEVLSALVGMGLVRRDGARYIATESAIHLEKNSPFIPQHHANWRLRAIESFGNSRNEENMHYSYVLTCGKKDLDRIKMKLREALREVIADIQASPNETLAAINLDCFEWIR